MQIVVQGISKPEADRRGVGEWPVTERGVSRYSWHYDATEICYLVSGRVLIETEDGNVEVEEGDLVTLPAGLDCIWDVRERIVKRYRIES